MADDRGAGRAGQGALRRAGPRRLRARAAGRRRAPRPAQPAAPGRLARAGAHPAGARHGPRGRRPVRRLARRRAAARGPTAARHGREGPRRSSRPSTARAARAGAAGLVAVCRRAGVPVPPHLGRCPHRVAARRCPSVAAGRDWPVLLAEAARAAVEGGRGAVLVVPDHRDVVRVEAALLEVLGPGRHTRLTADQGPQARYTAYLKALRGHAQVVVGTRAAAFAPVRDLGLVAVVGRRRRPARRAAGALPARARGAAGPGAACTAPRVLVRRVRPVGGGRRPRRPRGARPRSRRPARRCAGRCRRCGSPGEGHDADRDPAVAAAHLPTIAWRTAKEALERGPVLVQVPRRGYLPSLSCQDCRRPARCTVCAGPLGAARAAGAAGLPVVRPGRDRLQLPGLQRPPAALVRRRRPAHRRGARPRVPGVPGRALRRRHRARDGRRPGRAWSSRRPAPSRSPPTATPPRCCSTPGR